MKRRGLRVTLTAGAIGLAVVAGLVAFNWDVVRDHVEAWRFVMTRQTRSVSHLATSRTDNDPVFQYLADCLRRPVIFDPQVSSDYDEDATDIAIGYLYGSISSFNPPLTPDERLRALSKVDGQALLDALRMSGYRILEQLFPRPALVVVENPFLRFRNRWFVKGPGEDSMQ